MVVGVREIIREQGIRGTYQGMSATIIKQGSNHAIRFFIMDTLKDWYRGGDNNKPVNNLEVGMFGVVAGAASVFSNAPVDMIKTRMQGLEASKYSSTLNCIYQIAKYEGIPAFYKGTLPRLGRVCLEVPITFMVYDSLMDIFIQLWKT